MTSRFRTDPDGWNRGTLGAASQGALGKQLPFRRRRPRSCAAATPGCNQLAVHTLYCIKFFMSKAFVDEPARARWLPRTGVPGRVARKSALLVMPFYPKSRHGSLGKHVLTPCTDVVRRGRRDAGRLAGSHLGRKPVAGPPPS